MTCLGVAWREGQGTPETQGDWNKIINSDKDPFIGVISYYISNDSYENVVTSPLMFDYIKNKPRQLAPGSWTAEGHKRSYDAAAASKGKSTRFSISEPSHVTLFYLNGCPSANLYSFGPLVSCYHPLNSGEGYWIDLSFANITGSTPTSGTVSEENEEDPEKLKTFVDYPTSDTSQPCEKALVTLTLDKTGFKNGTSDLVVSGSKHQLWKHNGTAFIKTPSSTLNGTFSNYTGSGELGGLGENNLTYYIQPLEQGELTATLTNVNTGIEGNDNKSDVDFVKIKVEQCSSCSTCSAGESNFTRSGDRGQAGMDFSLGSSALNSFNGSLSLAFPDAPLGMQVKTSNVKLSLRPGENNEAITDSTGKLKQVKTSSELVTLETVNDYKYQIKYYAPSSVGEKGGDESEEYAVTGEPYRVITVEDPLNSDLTTDFKISNTFTINGSSVTRVDEMVWNAQNATWDHIINPGTSLAKTESYYTTGLFTPGETHSNYSVIKDANGTTVSKTKTTYQVYRWGERKIQTVIDPDGRALTTNYSYYDNDNGDGVCLGRLKAETRYDGTWERYEYDSTGRQAKTITPFNNSAITDAESLCRVVETTYDDANKVQGSITRVLGTEVSRSYTHDVSDFETHDIQCTVAGAAYDAASNLVTVTKKHGIAPFAGKIKSVKKPDGTLKLYEYGQGADYITETVYEGAGNPAGDTVTDGVKTVIRKNAFGREIYRRSYDIATNKVIGFSSSSAVDALGRPTAVQDMDGTVQNTVYGCCGPERTSDKAGTETLYGYDAQKRLGHKTTAGVTELYTYDAMGRTVAVTKKGSNGAEASSTTAYNVAGETVSETNAIGDSTAFSEAVIDGKLVKTAVYPDGSTHVQKLNNDSSPAEVSGTAAHPVTFEYGVENGELYVKKYPTDRPTEWVKTYVNFRGKQYKTLYADSSVSTTYFDEYGREFKKVSPSGVIELVAYDSRGRVSAVAIDMDRNGTIDYSGTDIVKKYEYSVVEEGGAVCFKTTEKACLTDGNATETVINESYTAANGLSKKDVSFGRTSTQTLTYNGSGSITVLMTNPDNSTVTQSYLNGKLMSSVHSVLGTTTYTYDQFNNKSVESSTVNGSTRVSSVEYDLLGRPSVVKDAANRETTFVYDQVGRRIKAELPGGRAVYYRYYPTGELKEQFGSDIYPFRKVIDSVGRLKTLETYKSFVMTGPSSGYKTLWNYSTDRGFMTSKTYPDTHEVTYTYNTDGLPLTRVWSRGITTTYSYDNAGMQSGVSYSDGTTPAVTYTRNRQGLPVSITDGTGTRTLTYNSDSSLASEGSVSYTYDTLGRRSTMVYGGNTTSYTYDSMSRFATVSDGVRTTTYSRVSGSNLLSSINMNNVVTVSKSYDVLDRLTSISSAAGGKTYSYNYTYNDADKRSKCTLADGTYWVYEYDDLGQIIRGKKHTSNGIEIPGQSFGYDYDTIGNLKSENRNGSIYKYTSNSVNQYTQRTIPGYINIAGKAHADAKVTIHRTSQGTSGYTKPQRSGEYYNAPYNLDNSSSAVSETFDIYAVKFDSGNNRDVQAKQTLNIFIPQTPQTFTYDNDGNMTGDNKSSYTWNADNRLTKVEQAVTQKTENVFDFMGRRVTKKIYNWVSNDWSLASHIKFVYSGWLLVGEIDGETSNILKIYTWGEDIGGSLNAAGGVGGLLSETNASGTYFPVYDGRGNITAYVDSSGNKVAEYRYDPFGRLISSWGPKANDFAYRFSTKYYDVETGLYYHENRFYSPDLRRFLNNDPIEEQGGPNQKNYVGNDPINRWDYLGYSLWDYTKFAKWLFDGNHTTQQLDWNYFDPGGTEKKALIQGWQMKNLKVLFETCDNASDGERDYEISTQEYKDEGLYSDAHPWISYWKGRVLTKYPITIEKKDCKCNFKVGLDFYADDISDFNKGESFGPKGFFKDDWFIYLRDNTNLGHDYKIFAEDYQVITWIWEASK